jgi:hypothetical protein
MSGAGLRPELAAIVDQLLAASAPKETISLDALGDVIGTRAISADEIDAMMRALEAHDRVIGAPEGGGGEEHLRTVIATARALSRSLGRRPTIAEIASQASIAERDVRHALFLARIMQR